MTESLAHSVRHRAGLLCEYCRLPESASAAAFEIDHIIARKHGGATALDNLAYSCFYCNSAKGPNIAGIDSESGIITRLFHPRQDVWSDHFRWDGAVIVGRTPIGRATIQVLNVNLPDMIALRRLLSDEGLMVDEANSI